METSTPGQSASKPLVSVIIRTKDRPEQLAEAIDSVLQQDYRPLELVVVNDGGGDVGAQVSEQAGSLDAGQYLHQAISIGRSAAANAGLEAAQGDFAIFLDDDDLFLPEHISRLQAAITPELRLAYAGVDCVRPGENGEWQSEHRYEKAFDPVLLLVENYIPIHAALFDRRLAVAHCRFDESMDTYEDWDFWLQMLRQTGFAYVSGVSALYRVEGEGGFGLEADSERVRTNLSAFFQKWGPRWSADELLAVAEYAKHYSMYHEQRVWLSENENKLGELHRAWEELHAELERYRRRYEEQLEERQLVEGKLQTKEQEWEASQALLKESERSCLALQNHARQQEQAIEQMHQDYQAVIGRITSSVSWRLTKPLRAGLRLSRYPAKAYGLWREQGRDAVLRDLREHPPWRGDGQA